MKIAGLNFAAYPNLEVEYFLYTPVSFPVPAFWWNFTIKLEHSLQRLHEKVNENTSSYQVISMCRESNILALYHKIDLFKTQILSCRVLSMCWESNILALYHKIDLFQTQNLLMSGFINVLGIYQWVMLVRFGYLHCITIDLLTT